MGPLRRDERGAATVEFALVLPLLLALVIGIFGLGQAYQAQTTLSQASRVGVRVMSLGGDVQTARQAVREAAQPLAVDDNQIAISPSSCFNRTGNVTVTISYPMQVLAYWDSGSVTLQGKGVMRCHG